MVTSNFFMLHWWETGMKTQPGRYLSYVTGNFMDIGGGSKGCYTWTTGAKSTGQVNTALSSKQLAQDSRLTFLFSKCKTDFLPTTVTLTKDPILLNKILSGTNKHCFLQSTHSPQGKLNPTSSYMLEQHLQHHSSSEILNKTYRHERACEHEGKNAG